MVYCHRCHASADRTEQNRDEYCVSLDKMPEISNPLRPLPLGSPVQVHPGYAVLPPIQAPDSTEAVVHDFWTRLGEHIQIEQTSMPYTSHGNQHTRNKVVRIFVSSTFTDFFNEREVLIKKVLTSLRDEMSPFGIQIIDCDLRWGVRINENQDSSGHSQLHVFGLGSQRCHNRTNHTGLSRRTRSMPRRQWSTFLHWTTQ
jgi:hypothetical protein